MRRLLPFTLTGAQERVLREIQQDMSASRAMQRLVQGDVGAGKTMVAWFASLRVIESGYQAVWMAPTELLAEQHFRNIARICRGLENQRRAAHRLDELPRRRKLILGGVESGEIQFLVGTHALIQEGVRVPRLGLGVIDEQHRFGVVQRLSLAALARAGRETGCGFARAAHAAHERDADTAQSRHGAVRRSRYFVS